MYDMFSMAIADCVQDLSKLSSGVFLLHSSMRYQIIVQLSSIDIL